MSSLYLSDESFDEEAASEKKVKKRKKKDGERQKRKKKKKKHDDEIVVCWLISSFSSVFNTGLLLLSDSDKMMKIFVFSPSLWPAFLEYLC